jgi:SAM-dependent methyltransferase
MSWLSLIYDPILALPERWVLSGLRREILSGLAGRVLEIGAGSGANLAHFPPDVDLVATEPDAGMRALLEGRAEVRPRTQVVGASAERLPFPEASFDAAVGTLVLCSVHDPDLAAAELRRVLRPGGRYLFLEHTASDGWRGLLQRAMDPAWQRVAGRCHLRRDPRPTLAAAGFELGGVREIRPRIWPPFFQPLVLGEARAV